MQKIRIVADGVKHPLSEKKIAYIESRMDMTNMTVVYGIYNKALENRTFQTPVGLEFMHKLWYTGFILVFSRRTKHSRRSGTPDHIKDIK